MLYAVSAKLIPDRGPEFHTRLTDGSIAAQRPDGAAVVVLSDALFKALSRPTAFGGSDALMASAENNPQYQTYMIVCRSQPRFAIPHLGFSLQHWTRQLNSAKFSEKSRPYSG